VSVKIRWKHSLTYSINTHIFRNCSRGNDGNISTECIRNKTKNAVFVCPSFLHTKSVEKGIKIEPDEYVQNIFDGLKNQDRGSLARAITLIETSNPQKKVQAKALLNLILHDQEVSAVHTMKGPPTFRIGRP
jgi:hypothetical protein